MGTCTTCGARVTPDLEWCGQCLRAVAAPEPDPRVGPRMLLSPARGPTHEAVHSRWYGGATWFGPLARIFMTLGVLMAVPVGYPMLRGLILATVGFDIPGRGLVLLWLAVAIPGAMFLLARVWSRTRVA